MHLKTYKLQGIKLEMTSDKTSKRNSRQITDGLCRLCQGNHGEELVNFR